MYYPVPYQYIRNTVDARIKEHMPQDHQKYLEWNGDRFRHWTDSIKMNAYKIVDAKQKSRGITRCVGYYGGNRS